MPPKLSTILQQTNLYSIINSPTLERGYNEFSEENTIDKLTYDKLTHTITLMGQEIQIKHHVHTLVDDFKALIHNFWEYYRHLTQLTNFDISLTRDMEKLNSDNKSLSDRFKLFEEKIKLDETKRLTIKHKTIDDNKTDKKEDINRRITEKKTATRQMYQRIDRNKKRIRKKQEKEKKKLIEIEKNLKKHQEDLKQNKEDLKKFYVEIIEQITVHMKKFKGWETKDSEILMTSIELNIPSYTIDKPTGLAVLTAPHPLNKLQNIGKLLYKLRKKIIFLEKTNNANEQAEALMREEEEAKESSKKKRRKKKEKQARQKSRKKDREKVASAAAAAKQEPQPEPEHIRSSTAETAIVLIKSFNLETILDETKFGNLLRFIDAIEGLLNFEILHLLGEQVARVDAPIVAAEIKKRVKSKRNSDQNFWHKYGFVIDDNLGIPLPMYLLEFFIDFKGLISNDVYREYILSNGILSRGVGDVDDANSKIEENRPKLIHIIKSFQALWKGEEINDNKADSLLDNLTGICMNPDSIIIKKWYDQLSSIHNTLVFYATQGNGVVEEKPKKKKKKKKKKNKKTKKKNNSKKKAEEDVAPAAAPTPTVAEKKTQSEHERANVGESNQDPIRVRIEDISSYLTEKKIPLKREEEKSFMSQEANILKFISELNDILPLRLYKLVITGGYAIRMHGGNNKTGDIDMVLCHNNDVGTARGFITGNIFKVKDNNKDMDVDVLQFAPGTKVNDPTNPVKIRINGVQAIDITFKYNTDNFCEEVELINNFSVLKADFMKRNLMKITNNFSSKLTDGVISHDAKLVSWLHQMTSLNKLLTERSRTPRPHPGGGRKTKRKKRKRKRTRKKRKK